MNAAVPPPAPEPSAPPGPGAEVCSREEARHRLLRTALRLFANQGFKRTSIREIAEAAQVNVAAISYYFGDKAGLYRAAFFEPVSTAAKLSGPCDPAEAASLPPEAVLRAFFAEFLAPLREGETARLCMKLRFREMLEPTGLWDEEIAEIRQVHGAMAAWVAHHLGCPVDDGVHRLVICLTGLCVHLHVGYDVIEQVAPTVQAHPQAIDAWIDNLLQHAMAMIDSERRRRASAAAPIADPGETR